MSKPLVKILTKKQRIAREVRKREEASIAEAYADDATEKAHLAQCAYNNYMEMVHGTNWLIH